MDIKEHNLEIPMNHKLNKKWEYYRDKQEQTMKAKSNPTLSEVLCPGLGAVFHLFICFTMVKPTEEKYKIKQDVTKPPSDSSSSQGRNAMWVFSAPAQNPALHLREELWNSWQTLPFRGKSSSQK